MIGHDHKLHDLRRLPLLAACTDEEIQTVAATGDLLYFRSGDVLRPAGADGSFYVLLSGTAVLGRDAVLGPGDSDGAVGLLGGEPERDELRMFSDGRVLVVGRREFAALLWAVPGFAKGLAHDLSQRLRRQHARNFGGQHDRFQRSA